MTQAFRRIVQRCIRPSVCTRAILASLFWVCCATQSFAAAQAEVIRNANLRREASSENPPIRLLKPPEVVTLLETTRTNNYYHVRTEQNEEGWAWANNLEVEDPAAVFGLSTTAVSTAISPNWQKPAPNKVIFHGQGGDCPWNGDGGDPDTFWLKNRTDVPSALHDVTWSSIALLDYPIAPRKRKNWSQQQLDAIKPVEGVALRVVGYLVAIKPQSGSGEGTNCGLTASADTDIHLALVEKPGDAEAGSVVIEITPRFKQVHTNWKKAKLTPWLDTDKPVRITGWLMLDPDHRNHLQRYRSTLWEIHPITKIEVFQDGAWVDLDML